MNRNEFIEQLSWLLQDIPEDEREGAIEYYQDYFDEAGIGAEDETGEKLGSPEKVAAMVRDGLTGDNTDAGEYTETGYQDKRFKEKENMPERRDAFQKEEQKSSSSGQREDSRREGGYDYNGGGSYSQGSYNQYGSKQYYSQNYQSDGSGYRTSDRTDNTNAGKIILIVLLCIFAIPVIIPIAGVVFGIAAGIFGLVFGLLVGAAALTLAGIICGIVLTGIGIAQMFTTPGIGLMFAGLGMFSLALGVLMIWLTVTIAGRFIPWFVRVIVNIFSMIFHRRGGQAA